MLGDEKIRDTENTLNTILYFGDSAPFMQSLTDKVRYRTESKELDDGSAFAL
jgi:hypothetical protein